MMRAFFTTCAIVSTQISLCQEDSLVIRKIADEILINGKAYENLRVLTKTIGGRLSGSPQMYMAESWGQRALREAGADTVYLQACMVPHWIRGPKDEAMYYLDTGSRASAIPLNVLSLGNSVGTGPGGISAPLILIHSFEELEHRKNEVKGKIVFFNYKFNPTFIQTFDSYADAVRYRAVGPSRAAKYGALAVLVRSMTHAASDNNAHTGALRYTDSLVKIPAAAIGLQDADKLEIVLEKNKQVKAVLKTGALMLPDTVAHNIIAEIKGSLIPEQYITVGGHLDSWDPAEGAHDDGAGCVHSIEVLRALKAIGYKPKHTIRIVLFANEENGTRGGNQYAFIAKQKKEHHVFAVESDAGGFTPRAFSVAVSDQQLVKVRQWIPLLQPYGVYEFVHFGGGTDVEPLNNDMAVPVAELRPDSQRYFDYHHSANDVFENVNQRELELGAINIAALIYLVDRHGL